MYRLLIGHIFVNGTYKNKLNFVNNIITTYLLCVNNSGYYQLLHCIVKCFFCQYDVQNSLLLLMYVFCQTKIHSVCMLFF